MAREEVRKQFRLAELMRPEIAELVPHQPIPGERQLAERFGVSRVTIRQALSLLQEDGTIYTVHGSGSFAAPARVTIQMKLLSFTEEMLHRGLTPSTRVISVDLLQPDDERAILDAVVLTEPALRIERLRLGAGEPMSLEVSYIDQSHAPTLMDCDLSQSLYKILEEKFGHEVVSADEHLTPVVLNKVQAHLLKIEIGSPAFAIHRIGYDMRGREIESSIAIRRGDRWDFRYTVRI